jgi:1,2-diacylglycerol 3-beta-glucosyltransferase
MVIGIVAGLLWLAWIPVAASCAYLAMLALAARRRAPLPSACSTIFRVVVPAHNEEGGIERTVKSLFASDYPSQRFGILVVADNCTDGTAERARRAGAEVLVRDDRALRGKGYALQAAFTRLLEEGVADAVVVVDADTTVSPNLLSAFAARIERGVAAAQASYRVGNADESWRTRLMTIAFATYHELRSLARETFGASCGLRGNGMCISMRVLRAVPYDAYSRVEDVECGDQLAEHGYRVSYTWEAAVYGDMVSSEPAARSQRLRWEEGRGDLRRAHSLRLLAAAIRTRSGVVLDAAIDLLVPPLTTVVVAVCAGLVASVLLQRVDRGARLVSAWTACAGCLLLYVARGWQLSGTGIAGLIDLAHAPAYIVWKCLLMLRPRARDAEWVRTPRNSEIALGESRSGLSLRARSWLPWR